MKYVLGLVGVWLVACIGCLDLASSNGSGSGGAGGNGGGGGGAECIPDAPCSTSLLGVCAQGLQVCDASMTCTASVEPSTERCDTAEDESCDGKGCSGAVISSMRFGDAVDQTGKDVKMDSQGNLVVAGWFHGVLDLGDDGLQSAGAKDIFVAKFDPLRKLVWARRFGDSSWQGVEKIALDSNDNIFIGGDNGGTITFGNDVVVADPMGGGEAFVAKLDPNGTPLWIVQSTGLGYQGIYDVCTDDKGNVIAVGQTDGVADFGGGPIPHAGGGDILVWKLDGNGDHVWSKSYGDVAYQGAWAVAADGAGSVYLTGETDGPVDFGGGLMPHGGAEDGFLVKLDAAGNHVWGKVFGDSAKQYGSGITSDAAGNVVLTFHYEGTVNFGGQDLASIPMIGDMAIARFDSGGNHVWSKRLFNTGAWNGFSPALDGVGNIVIVGATNGSLDFGGGTLMAQGRDLVVAKLDSNGNEVWSERYGATGATVVPNEVAVGKLGDTWVAGILQGAVTIGGDVLEGAGKNDVFIAHFEP